MVLSASLPSGVWPQHEVWASTPRTTYTPAQRLIPPEDATMPDQDWIKTLADSRRVKFIYQELADNGAFLSAQVEGNEVVYSIILTKVKNLLSREDVEKRFEAELSKK